MKNILFIFLAIIFLGCPDDEPCTTCPTPIDTTSHNWVFEPPQFLGDGASSVLRDVVIINDSLAYAVGAIYFQDDSTGEWDSDAYNAAKWDGEKWKLLRIPFIGSCSAVTYPPLRAIWAFSPTDILVTNGGSIVHYDGINATMDCRMNSLLTGAITKIFAFSPQDIYLVGGVGTIVHYSNSTWTKIESGTNFTIMDIWGDYNFATKQYEILCVASSETSLDKEVLKINGTSVQKLDNKGIGGTLSSVWFKSDSKYYVAGAGIYDKDNLSDTLWKSRPYENIQYYTTQVRANGVNDIIAAGDFGDILHYNYKSWRSYFNETHLTYGGYASIDIKNNLVIAVGSDPPLAAVIIGRRK